MSIAAVALWGASFSVLWVGIQQGAAQGFFGLRRGGIKAEQAAVEAVVLLLREIEETLAAGLVPASSRWEDIRGLPKPWGPLVHESVEELRRQGGALLPTLERLRDFAAHHQVVLSDARSKSAQALVQAWACAVLVPLFGGLLYVLLPGVQEFAGLWSLACLIAIGFSAWGARWIYALATRARWAGIPEEHRSGLLSVQCAAERFLALLRAGTPADVAWSRSCEWLASSSSLLASAWGHSVWAAGRQAEEGEKIKRLEPLIELGQTLRKSAQVSLMEGRPCLQRCEAALSAFRTEMKSRTDRELALLPTQALKPLFLCVAPALLGLLGIGLWLAFIEQLGSFGAG